LQTVEDLILKLESLPGFVKAVGDGTIEDKAKDILDLNKSQMLTLGVDSEGAQLGDYAPLSIQERKKKGLQTEFIDLRFNGHFQDSMNIKKEGKGFELNATDAKWNGDAIFPSLSQQWPDALGLTEDNEKKVTDLLTEKIGTKVDEFLSNTTPPKVYANV
jgi:hypothetical protein